MPDFFTISDASYIGIVKIFTSFTMSENRKGSITSNRSISVGGDKGKLAKVSKSAILKDAML